MPLKIDKGIPVPDTSLAAEIRRALRTMKPGDSFVLCRCNEVYRHAKQMKVSVRARKQEQGGYRIWRVK